VPVDDGGCPPQENSSLDELSDAMLSSLLKTRCLGPPTDDQLSEIPLLSIEQTYASWKGMKYRRDLSEQGGLYPPRLPHIRRYCDVYRGPKGWYLASDLDSNPHYEHLPSVNADIRRVCDEARIEFKEYLSDRNYLSKDDKEFRIYNGSGDEELDRLHEQLPLTELIIETLQRGERDPERNTFMHVVGYTSNMSTKVKGGVARPTFRGPASDAAKKANIIMSNAAKHLFEPIKTNDMGIFDDPDRQSEYAGSKEAFCSEEARIEALAFSVQILDENLLGIHADSHNDYTEIGRKHNYHYTVVAWYYFTVDGVPAKFTIIGYTRASIPQAMYREELYREYFENVVLSFFERISSKRKNLDRGIFDFDESIDRKVESMRKDGQYDICRPPHINKEVYYSAYVDALLHLHTRYREFSGQAFTIYRFAEALLPIVFCNGPSQYNTILRTWADCKENLPDLSCNYTEVYMVQALEKFKFANLCYDAHGMPRHQTTFNHAVARRWIYASLKVLVKVLLKCSGDKKKRPTFEQANEELQDILHVGGLAANHILHFAALIGAIPSCYADGAIVSKTTKSSDRLREEHGITNKRGLLTFLKEQGTIGTESVAENGGVCEALRPPDHPYGDIIFSEQSAIYYTDPNLCAQQDDEYLVKVIPRTAGDEDRTSCLQLGRLSLPKQVYPADHDSNDFHWSQYMTANAGVSPDLDTVIRVNNKQGTGPIARISKMPRGVDKLRKSLKNATKTRVFPEATSLGRDPRAIAKAANLGYKFTDPAQALLLLALHKVASEGGEVTCVDEECVDEDDIYRVEDTKALEDSQLLGILASHPDDAWDKILDPSLQMRMVYQLGMRDQYGRFAKPIGDSFPTPTELYNKNVRLEMSEPLVCLRASAGFNNNDTKSIVLNSFTIHDEEDEHTMAAVLNGNQEYRFQGDFSPTRDMSVGLVRDSDQGPPYFSSKEKAQDALSWHLVTRPETKEIKDSPEWPFRPSNWLRRIFGTVDKWTEYHPNGPRYVILGNHHNTSVKEAGQKRGADATPPSFSAPNTPKAEIVAVMRHYNDEVRIAFMKEGELLTPFVIAEDFILGDAPVRRKRRKRRGRRDRAQEEVPDMIGACEYHANVKAKKEEKEKAKKEQPRLLIVASPPVEDEPSWGEDEDEEEKGPPERLGRFWAAGWKMRVIMRKRCEDLDCYYDCPHTRVTIRSKKQLRKHLRYICGNFTSPQHLNERIKAAEFVWGCEGDSAYNELIGRHILLAREANSDGVTVNKSEEPTAAAAASTT